MWGGNWILSEFLNKVNVCPSDSNEVERSWGTGRAVWESLPRTVSVYFLSVENRLRTWLIICRPSQDPVAGQTILGDHNETGREPTCNFHFPTSVPKWSGEERRGEGPGVFENLRIWSWFFHWHFYCTFPLQLLLRFSLVLLDLFDLLDLLDLPLCSIFFDLPTNDDANSRWLESIRTGYMAVRWSLCLS